MTTGAGDLRAAMCRLAPVLVLALLAVTTLAVLASAGTTLGYDFQAYAQAADRLLAGERLYDPTVDVAGGFAIYLYPPPFAFAIVPFALLPEPAATWAWLAALVGAFLAGVALLPVRTGVRVALVGLAAISWPFLYSVKLGQVGPLLFLAFAVAWRAIDRPALLGIATAAGAIVKVQPALLLGWMLVTRRWRALAVAVGAGLAAGALATVAVGITTWSDYAELLGRVSQPVTTPHNMTPGAIAYRAGAGVDAATVVQYAAMAATLAVTGFAWLRRDAATGLVVGAVASQLLSPLLWDHYAMLLLLPTALLLERRHWWAAAIPVLPWLPTDLVYPAVFAVGLVGPIVAPSAE